jgi:hypothetical protein
LSELNLASVGAGVAVPSIATFVTGFYTAGHGGHNSGGQLLEKILLKKDTNNYHSLSNALTGRDIADIQFLYCIQPMLHDKI